MDTKYMVVFTDSGDKGRGIAIFDSKEAAQEHAKNLYINGYNYAIYEARHIEERSVA